MFGELDKTLESHLLKIGTVENDIKFIQTDFDSYC